jgi:signal transduction histidine kinase
MPITSKTFVRSTALLLLVGLLALLAIVGTNVWLVERSQGYFDEISEGRRARAAAITLRNLLQDMETSQRGFIITQDENYLGPYNDSQPQVEQQLVALETILAPFPTVTGSVKQLREDVLFKVNEMFQTIETVRAGDVTGTVERIRTDTGKEAMDRIRTFLSTLLSGIDQRLAEGDQNQRDTLTMMRWVSIIGSVVILLVVAGAMWAVLSYTQELARARQEVEEANSSLEIRVQERTADLGKANEEIQRFAYIVTHDLRAPLVNIMGFTAELETSVDDVKAYMERQTEGEDDPVAAQAQTAATVDLPEAISFIRAATRKMDGLINAILKISREGRRRLNPEQIDLAELIETSAAAVHHQVSESQGEISTDIRVGKLVTDKLSIEQILGNLLDNAIKYQDPSRPLRIAVSARHVPGNRVVIEIEDNGRGIADPDHERVFELFRRSGSQTRPGEGIGLAHVRTMVRSLGGDVALTSRLGQGTTFIVNLPRDSRSYLGSFGA